MGIDICNCILFALLMQLTCPKLLTWITRTKTEVNCDSRWGSKKPAQSQFQNLVFTYRHKGQIEVLTAVTVDSTKRCTLIGQMIGISIQTVQRAYIKFGNLIITRPSRDESRILVLVFMFRQTVKITAVHVSIILHCWSNWETPHRSTIFIACKKKVTSFLTGK